MNIISLQKKFVYSLKWNSLESILYYFILAAHQLLLRTITNTTTYGTIGTLFALIYLTITIMNFGLDLSIGPFFSTYKSCKKQFRHYLIKQLLIQALIYCAAATVIFLILATGYLPIKDMPPLALPLSSIIAILIISEGIKKCLRIILQLAFLMHITTAVELFYIISYVALIWMYYFIWGGLSLYVVFIPMLILSFCATISLCWATYGLYRSIPKSSVDMRSQCEVSSHEMCSHEVCSGKACLHTACSWKKIGYNRLSNYGYQLTKTLFTSNFLIPFFAIKCGLSLAALFELVTAFNQFITIIIQKIFGITGQSLLSHVKHRSLTDKRVAFEFANNKLYPLLYGIIAAIFVIYKPLLAFKSAHFADGSSSIGFLFFALLFSENFIILYEKWFVIEEKTVYLILFNSLLLAIFWVIIQLPYFNSPTVLLAILIVLRIAACLLLSIISSYKWKLSIPYKTKPRLAYILLFLLGYYLLLR